MNIFNGNGGPVRPLTLDLFTFPFYSTWIPFLISIPLPCYKYVSCLRRLIRAKDFIARATNTSKNSSNFHWINRKSIIIDIKPSNSSSIIKAIWKALSFQPFKCWMKCLLCALLQCVTGILFNVPITGCMGSRHRQCLDVSAWPTWQNQKKTKHLSQ